MPIRKRTSSKAKNGIVYEVYFTYKQNGITMRYSKSGFATKKEAKDHEALKKAEVQETGRIKKEIKKTLFEVYNEFIEVCADQYQENTIINTKTCLNYWKRELGSICIKDFNYTLLQRFFNSRSEYGLETNKKLKTSLKRIFDYALKAEYIKSNPIILVQVKGKENHRPKNILAHNDFIKIIRFLDNSKNFKYQAYSIAIQIGYYTGLRVSEALALEKNDIDFVKNTIDINKKLIYTNLKKEEFHTTTKLKSSYSKDVIPLPEVLKKVLIRWFDINPYNHIICDIEGYYIHPKHIAFDIQKTCNIPFHFHMLRHTYATNLALNNVDMKVAKDLLRHSNINTTISVYTHINEQYKKDVVDEIFKTKSVENVSKTNFFN